MENGPLIDDVPMKTSMYEGFSMAMLVITRLYVWPFPKKERKKIEFHQGKIGISPWNNGDLREVTKEIYWDLLPSRILISPSSGQSKWILREADPVVILGVGLSDSWNKQLTVDQSSQWRVVDVSWRKNIESWKNVESIESIRSAHPHGSSFQSLLQTGLLLGS